MKGPSGQGEAGTIPAGQTWDDIQETENALIWKRREQLGRLALPKEAPVTGLALSGGGIRSATFSLGLLKGLSSARLISRFDYLSTVSGGGYAGTFLRSLFVPPQLRGRGSKADNTALCKAYANPLNADPLGSDYGKKALAQLREGGHFLSPNGTSDALFAMVIAGRNWLATMLVSGVMLLALFLALNIPRAIDSDWARNAATPAVKHAGEVAFPAPEKPPTPEEIEKRRKAELERQAEEAKTTQPTSAEAKSKSGGSVACTAQIDPATESPLAKCTVSPPAPAKEDAKPRYKIGKPLGASWLWLVALLLLPLWPAACAWAYWQTRSAPVAANRIRRLASLPTLVALSFAALLMWLLATDRSLTWAELVLGAATATSAVLGVFVYAAALISVAGAEDSTPEATDSPRGGVAWWTAEEDRVRTLLSRWLFRGLFFALAFAGLALADDAGRLVYHLAIGKADWNIATGTGALGAVSLLIVPVARFLLKRVQSSGALNWQKFGPGVRRFGRAIALVAGLVLGAALVVFWAACAYAIFWHGNALLEHKAMNPWPPLYRNGAEIVAEGWAVPVIITAFVALWALLLGGVHSFLNRSSFASFYAARLRKAYLGASNQDRIDARTAPDLELSSDEIELAAYYDKGVLAPLHLINVTVNETTSKSSRVIQRDRKGKPLTVGPAGYVFVEGKPTEKASGYPLDQGEQLPLSTWMGISGAAFSTGMGQHGSFGMSLLAALTNMRLGYWWNSPHRVGWRTASDLVQSYLLRELRADFEGTHTNRWYLSDGGHFENMGVYELVRRRVSFIVASDNGADPNYEFADFINLVRKIRIDFDAETVMVSAAELDSLLGKEGRLRDAFGTLDEIGAAAVDDGKARRGGPYATLARIRFRPDPDAPADAPPPPDATLLMIKPRIAGGELPDILRYHKKDATFPQQRTTDLFFDEAQWESYFRLGQLIAEAIFSPEARAHAVVAGGRWFPSDLQPLPPLPTAAG